MKKRLWFYTTFFICVVLLYAGGRFCVARQEKEEWENLWKTNRSLPEDLDVHAYLSGNFARQTGKADVALKAYLNALEKDPNNQSLRRKQIFSGFNALCEYRPTQENNQSLPCFFFLIIL